MHPLHTARLTMLTAWLASGCTHTVGAAWSRPVLPAPSPLSPAVAIDRPELLQQRDHGDGRITGTLLGHGEQVRFDVRRALHRSGPSAPLALVVPILGGGENLMEHVATRLLDRGFDVAFCARVASALRPGQRGRDLDELFRRTVLHQRLLLEWLRTGDQPPSTTHVVGLSLGGMVATSLAAADPELAGVAICLSGGDIQSLITTSSEGRVGRWRQWRTDTDGVGDDHLRWELGQFLRHEPIAMARAVPTQKVLFIAGDFDTVIPERNRDLLWEALGRPQRYDVPLGHYTAALAIAPILDAVAEHFRARAAQTIAAAGG